MHPSIYKFNSKRKKPQKWRWIRHPLQIQNLEQANKMTCLPTLQALNNWTSKHRSKWMNLWKWTCVVLLLLHGSDRVSSLSMAEIQTVWITLPINPNSQNRCVMLTLKSTRARGNIKLGQNISLSHLRQRNQSPL